MEQNFHSIRRVKITRYVTPLREGGSLPAIAEADDEFLYVLKFRGAGQGVKALIAEYIGSEIARLLGLKVPELVFAELDEAFGRTEPDEEIQDLLKASTGLNLALHYLQGSITYDVTVNQPDAMMASQIVWLDAYLQNVDRTIRNPNLLDWNNELWLIDHGASLYFHYNWHNRNRSVLNPFAQVKDHVLLPWAGMLEEANRYCKNQITDKAIMAIVHAIPEDWLNWDEGIKAKEIKDFYIQYLTERRQQSHHFLKEAQNAKETLI